MAIITPDIRNRAIITPDLFYPDKCKIEMICGLWLSLIGSSNNFKINDRKHHFSKVQLMYKIWGILSGSLYKATSFGQKDSNVVCCLWSLYDEFVHINFTFVRFRPLVDDSHIHIIVTESSSLVIMDANATDTRYQSSFHRFYMLHVYLNKQFK